MSLDVEEYLKSMDKFLRDFRIVHSPLDSNKIYTVRRNPKDGKIVGISTNHESKLYLKEPYEDDTTSKLCVSEKILVNQNKANIVQYSFHFDPGETYLYTFRFDSSDSYYHRPHAHAYDYPETKKHLFEPEDIKLKLDHINLCSVLYLLNYYISHCDQYPLDNAYADNYNNILLSTRRKFYND